MSKLISELTIIIMLQIEGLDPPTMQRNDTVDGFTSTDTTEPVSG